MSYIVYYTIIDFLHGWPHNCKHLLGYDLVWYLVVWLKNLSANLCWQKIKKPLKTRHLTLTTCPTQPFQARVPWLITKIMKMSAVFTSSQESPATLCLLLLSDSVTESPHIRLARRVPDDNTLPQYKSRFSRDHHREARALRCIMLKVLHFLGHWQFNLSDTFKVNCL